MERQHAFERWASWKPDSSLLVTTSERETEAEPEPESETDSDDSGGGVARLAHFRAVLGAVKDDARRHRHLRWLLRNP